MRKLFIFLFLAMTASWGCHRKQSVPAQPPAPPPATAQAAPAESAPPAVTPAPVEPPPAPPDPAPAAKEIPEPGNLELGAMSFQEENYQQAARNYEAFLRDNPKSRDRDQALFHLGLSRVLANDGSRDLRQAETVFRRLIAESPGGVYKSQAAFIVGLLTQIDKLRTDIKERDERIKKLSDELQVLKEIDLQRRPTRPKE